MTTSPAARPPGLRSAVALLVAGMGLAFLPTAPASAQAVPETVVAITEIHYDNDGTDVGEFVEIAATNGTDISGYTIVLYNGSGGASYNTRSPGSATAADDGYDYAVIEYPVNGLQNGAPDGLALVDPDGNVVEFLSYEGVFVAVGGPADGLTSTDIGVSEPGTTPIGQSLQRTAPTEPTWTGPTAETRGLPTGANDPGPDPAVCDPTAEATLISAVQDSGDVSPLAGSPVFSAGRTVTLTGVVTVADLGLDGFFLQEEDVDSDNDVATSEGIYVYAPGAVVTEGSVVQVVGAVTENFSRTQIGSSGNGPADSVATCDTLTGTVTPVLLPLPSDDAAREAYEGMLITAEDLVVSGTFDDYRFGELVTGHRGELPQSTEVADPGTAADAVEALNRAREVRIDDRSNASIFGRSVWGMMNDIQLGDTTTVTGTLDYSFNNWKVQYSVLPTFTGDVEPVPTLEGGNDVVSFNVLNYFNSFDGRGARNEEQFEIQSAKIVTAITQMDAAVTGLIEIENDYEDEYDGDAATVPSAQTLVERLNEATAPGTYEWIRPPASVLTSEGLGGDAIAVGFIYQPARATPVGDATTFNINAELFNDPDKNRWPLAQTFDVDGEVFTAVVNHFKSKGSDCLATGSNGTPAFAVGEDRSFDQTGSCNLTRTYAANQLVEWVATDPTDSGDADVLLLGDYNSYAEEDPIDVLRNAGYVDLVREFDDNAYSYVFSGRVGRLDYAFASPSLAPKVTDTEVWQINSRAQYSDIYFRDPIDLTSAEGSSDHDPVIVALAAFVDDVNEAPVADIGGPYEVRVGNRTITLDASGSTDPDGDELTYAWDLDGDGDFDDASGPTATFTSKRRSPGSYPVAVQVTDPEGLTDVDTITVQVVTPGRRNS